MNPNAKIVPISSPEHPAVRSARLAIIRHLRRAARALQRRRALVAYGEEDLTEATRKLQALTGTIAGTKAITDAEALLERLAKPVKVKGLLVARDRIELSTLRFSVVCSTN